MPDSASSRPVLLSLALLLTLLLSATPARAQLVDCTRPVVPILGQDYVDDFDCTTISGTLFIRGNDFTNLAGLSELTSVGGDVSIEDSPALASLAGLENLTTIGGSFEIGSVGIGGNDALVTLVGLDGLTSVGGNLSIFDNLGLVSLTGLEGLTSLGGSLFIGGNDALLTLKGLDGLTAIPGDLKIGVSIFRTDGTFDGDNPALASLEGLTNLMSVGGTLDIQRNASLPSLDGLERLATVGGSFFISSSDALTSVEALTSLVSVGSDFGIAVNPLLASLDGLETLVSVRSLLLTNDPTLASIAALKSLTTITESLAISTTALTSLTGLEGVPTVGSATSGGIGIIENPLLESLAGLDNVTLVGGLGIGGNPLLTSLAELGSLTAIGSGGLFLGDDGEDAPLFDGLVSLTGLEGVTTIGGPAFVINMDVLESVAGLDNATSVDGDLWLENNPALESLTALSNVTSVDGFLIVRENDALTTLDGMEGITSIGPEGSAALFVERNDTLTDCACGLAGLIVGNPPIFNVPLFNGAPGVQINTNAPEGLCTSPEVVLAAPCTVSNAPPVADAGPGQSVTPGQAVTLDGTRSTDPDNDALTYAWTLDTPPGSAASLSDPTVVSPTFTADVAGAYTATLVVNDGTTNSAPDTATITAATEVSIVACTPSAPLLFSDWEVAPGEDPRGEYIELANDAGDGTSVDLAGCSFLVFDPFTENVTFAAAVSDIVLPNASSTSFANTVVGPGQMIPPNTLPDQPSVFALVQGSATTGQSVGDVLASSSVVAAVVLTYDGTEFGSVRGGASFATNSQALLDALAGLMAVAGEDGAAHNLELAVAPNPVAHQGQVSFGLAAGAEVRLALYDALGREVALLTDGPYGTGHHTVSFTATSLPAGVYVVRMTGTGAPQTARLTLTR